jgi:hypothetical protein
MKSRWLNAELQYHLPKALRPFYNWFNASRKGDSTSEENISLMRSSWIQKMAWNET